MSRRREVGLRLRSGVMFAGWMLAVGSFVAAYGQYPGHVDTSKGAAAAPVLRSTAVLEYTGDLTQPSAARLVPVAVWDGQRYQPGGLYMAQPVPITVESGTVYELVDAGASKGLFNVTAAANAQGSWVATGTYQKPAAPKVSKLKPSKTLPQFVHDSAAPDDGKPHFAHRPPGDSGTGQSGSGTTNGSGSGSASGSGASTGSSSSSADSDRPTLHRRTDSGSGQSGSGSHSGSDSGSGSGSSSGSGTASNAPDEDPDRPTMHKRTDSTTNSGSSSKSASSGPDVDPDRPTLHKHTDAATNPNDNGAPVSATTNVDPDRPHLGRGKPSEQEHLDVPTTVEIAKLAGKPDNLKLIAAISDAKTRAPHSYVYPWTDPDDAKKVQAALEDMAKNLLAGNTVTATVSGQRAVKVPGSTKSTTPAKVPPQKSTSTVTNSRTAAARKAAPPKPVLPDLEDEQFKAYELSFGGGATLVFSARSGQGDLTKYVTIIAQPDFNGVPQILFKQVTSESELDVVPRMQLVDAVDTDADNRAELIFALSGKTDKQFAIYKVHDRSVEQVFSTGGGA